MIKKVPPILRVVFSVIFLAGFSVALTYFILNRQFYYNEGEVWRFIEGKPAVFWFSCLLMFLLTGVIAALSWRPFIASGVMFALMSVATFVQMEKYQLRNEPFLPSDLVMVGQAGDLIGLIDAWGVVRLAAGAVMVILGTVLLEIWVRKKLGEKKKRRWWEKGLIIPRTSLALVAATAFLMSTQFLMQPSEEWTTEAEWLGTTFYKVNQVQNYAENGFLLGFVSNLTPEIGASEYSEEAIKEIYEQYASEKAADTERVKLGEVVDNLVVILDETFYDPELLGKYYAHEGGDVVPNVHKYFREYPSGYMYSTEYGGSTANVEYEVLTGLSNFWAQTMVYNNYTGTTEYMPGVATLAKSEGFEAIGLHSFTDTYFDRPGAYRAMQFDDYISLSVGEFKHTELENGGAYVSDRESFREILDYLEADDEPLLISMVTMQNHGRYDAAGYDEYHFTLDNQDVEQRYLVESSFESLHYADEYLGEFLEEVSELEERTVVLWFGDHAAGVLDEYAKSNVKLERDLSQLTPYFIYANFEIEGLYTTEEVVTLNEERGLDFEEVMSNNSSGLTAQDLAIDLPVVTPNCLMNMVYNVLGVEKPVLAYLLDDLCEEVPILETTYFSGATTLRAGAELRAYELINHDMLDGERYWALLEKN